MKNTCFYIVKIAFESYPILRFIDKKHKMTSFGLHFIIAKKHSNKLTHSH